MITDYFKKTNSIEKSFEAWGFRILDRWLSLKSRGETLAVYFADNDIHTIAIYGLGVLGKHLLEELQNADVLVKYGIDRKAASIKIDKFEIRSLKDELPVVDAIVITPISFYAIEAKLRVKMGEKVEMVSIEDVVDYCFRRQG